jgi:hypothetical protein
MLTALFETLERLTLDAGAGRLAALPAAEDVADALWLASQLSLIPSDELAPASVPAEPEAVIEGQPPAQDRVDSGDFASPPPVDQQVPLVAERGRTSEGAPSFRTPGAAALPHTLALSRALRPLRRRVPSRFRFTLDEEATAERAADEGVWQPVMRPMAERWLDLAIVIDDGPSMQIWRATTQELRRLLERQGIARDVRTWRLDTSASDRVRLLGATARGAAERGGERRPKEIMDASGRRLVVIVSDCVSPAWWNSAVADIIRVWSLRQPVSLVQMFPQRLWGQTALGTTSVVPVRSPGAASAGNTLSRIRRRKRLGGDIGQSSSVHPYVPVTTLEPEFVAVWSRFLGAPTGGVGPAIRLGGDLRRVEGEGAPDQPGILPSSEVEQFHARASPLTFQLACVFAATPLRLPVMRLVQRAMLPASGQVHLAEFMASGLLVRDSPDQEEIESALFDFKPGIREALLDEGTFETHLEVQRRISEYIAPRFGQALNFDAYLADPAALSSERMDAGAIPFAAVSAAVLRRMGAEYREAADQFLTAQGPSARSDASQESHPRPENLVKTEQADDSGLVAIAIAPDTPWLRIVHRLSQDLFGGRPGFSRFDDIAPDAETSPRWQAVVFADSFTACIEEILSVFSRASGGELVGIEQDVLSNHDLVEMQAVRPLTVADFRNSLFDRSAVSESNSAISLDRMRQLVESCFDQGLDGFQTSASGSANKLVLFNVRVREALRVIGRHRLLSDNRLDLALTELGIETTSAITTSPKQFAVVVGNDNYSNELPLEGVRQKVELIRRLLEDLGFQTLGLYNQDVSSIRNALDRLQEPGTDSIVLYWCGHLRADSDRISYLTLDSNITLRGPTTLDLKQITADIGSGHAKQTLIILDGDLGKGFRVSSFASNLNVARDQKLAVLVNGGDKNFARELDGVLRRNVLANGRMTMVSRMFDELRAALALSNPEPLTEPQLFIWARQSEFAFIPRRPVESRPELPPSATSESRSKTIEPFDPDSPAERVRDVASRVAEVIAGDTSGLGFFITDRVMVTANAVVPTDGCEVQMPGLGQSRTVRYSGRVVYRSSDLELALVELSASIEAFPRAPISFGVVGKSDLTVRQCTLVGFRGARSRDAVVNLKGEVVRSSRARFEIRLNYPQTPSDLRGFAGGVVLSDGLAIATLQTVEAFPENLLRASSLADLLEEAEFRQFWRLRDLPVPETKELPGKLSNENAARIILNRLDLVNRNAARADVWRAMETGSSVIVLQASRDDLPEVFLEGLTRSPETRNFVDSMIRIDVNFADKGAIARLSQRILIQISSSYTPTDALPRVEQVRRYLQESRRRIGFYCELPSSSLPSAAGAIRNFVEFWSEAASRPRGPSFPFFIVVLAEADEDPPKNAADILREAVAGSARLHVIAPFEKITPMDVEVWINTLHDLYDEVRVLLPSFEPLANKRWERTLRELQDEVRVLLGNLY